MTAADGETVSDDVTDAGGAAVLDVGCGPGALWEVVAAVADGEVEPLPGGFTAENGRDLLAGHFHRVERRTFENGVRVDDPDALVAYALSLPLSAEPLSAFEPGDAPALREAAAERIERDGAIEWRRDLALFVGER